MKNNLPFTSSDKSEKTLMRHDIHPMASARSVRSRRHILILPTRPNHHRTSDNNRNDDNDPDEPARKAAHTLTKEHTTLMTELTAATISTNQSMTRSVRQNFGNRLSSCTHLGGFLIDATGALRAGLGRDIQGLDCEGVTV